MLTNSSRTIGITIRVTVTMEDIRVVSAILASTRNVRTNHRQDVLANKAFLVRTCCIIVGFYIYDVGSFEHAGEES